MRSVQHGFAIVPTVCPMAGSTAPYSLAGTLLQSHIEVLMIALMAQVLRPTHPVEYVSGLSVTDLRSGADLYYTLDKVLWKNAAVQLGLAEHMPVGAECGGTLTPRYDLQSGAEGMLFMLAAHASGAHRIAGFGSCHNAVGMSAEMMVVQHAYLRAARHLTRGIRTDEPLLGTASLERVGPGGQFLDDELTFDLMRADEFFRDDVFDLHGACGNSQSLLERANERVEQLVSDYESRVPGDVQEGLRRYFAELYRRIGHEAAMNASAQVVVQRFLMTPRGVSVGFVCHANGSYGIGEPAQQSNTEQFIHEHKQLVARGFLRRGKRIFLRCSGPGTSGGNVDRET